MPTPSLLRASWTWWRLDSCVSDIVDMVRKKAYQKIFSFKKVTSDFRPMSFFLGVIPSFAYIPNSRVVRAEIFLRPGGIYQSRINPESRLRPDYHCPMHVLRRGKQWSIIGAPYRNQSAGPVQAGFLRPGRETCPGARADRSIGYLGNPSLCIVYALIQCRWCMLSLFSAVLKLSDYSW